VSAPVDKVCTRCGESKQPAAFYRAKGSADGLATQCRECSAERQRDRRARVRSMEPVAVDPRRLFYSATEAANICQRSERWVYRRVDSGELRAAERGRGVPLRITGRSLHALLERCGAL
jgi:hypothetical protein